MKKSFVLMLLLVFFLSCSRREEFKKPEEVAVAFWSMLFFEPSKCEDFLKDRMALQSRGEFFRASKEQVEAFCKRKEEYIRLYTKPKNITAKVDTEYEKGKFYLIAVELHAPRGEPTVVRTPVVKIKERWYVVP